MALAFRNEQSRVTVRASVAMSQFLSLEWPRDLVPSVVAPLCNAQS